MKSFIQNLQKELCGEVTDKFLELLLGGMDVSFCLSRGYRKNIENFEGRYLFQTADGMVKSAVTLKDGDMQVLGTGIEDWNTAITFKDHKALREFLFSKNQDILNSILANEVEVDGNLNYIYKFAFLARELLYRLRVN